MRDDILFNVETPLGFYVRTTRRYWDFLVTEKHEAMAGREDDVIQALNDPDEVRLSRTDPVVLIFYRLERPSRWLSVLAKRLNGEGYVVTAYPADSIKEGEIVWTRPRR